VKNAVVSISRFLSSVSEDGILCAEHTGAYGDLLVYLCNQVNIPIALVPGYIIKHSLGLLKGKSDPLDSKRIREYGERFTDKLEYAEYAEENIVELRQLYTLRNQLVKQRRALRTVDTGRGHQDIFICTFIGVEVRYKNCLELLHFNWTQNFRGGHFIFFIHLIRC